MLDPTFFDRFTMGFSLSIHIILAVVGVAIPLFIMLAEFIGIKYKDKHYITLANRMSIAFVILFAVGTASGMLVAVNLTFLWPPFMALVSKVAILPVYIEVFAFFGESIFLAIYIYSRKVLGNTYKHVFIMSIVAVCAAASAGLITVLNSFMNTPVGFNIATYLQTGQVTGINPLATFTAPAVGIEVSHVLATSYFAGAAILLAYFAYMYLKAKDEKVKAYYQKAIKLAFALTLIGVMLSVVTGILSISTLFYVQPEKYAAIELNLVSQSHAPELIGGILVGNAVEYGIEIPNLQSILENGNASTVVPGLNQYPQSTWPPLFIHLMFDFMVGLGFLIGLCMFIVLAFHAMKKKVFENRMVLWLIVALGFLAVVLLENGWLVDEFGRQPWIIYNVMLVSQAANQSSSIIPLAIVIIAMYAIILPLTIIVIRKVFSKRPLKADL